MTRNLSMILLVVGGVLGFVLGEAFRGDLVLGFQGGRGSLSGLETTGLEVKWLFAMILASIGFATGLVTERLGMEQQVSPRVSNGLPSTAFAPVHLEEGEVAPLGDIERALGREAGLTQQGFYLVFTHADRDVRGDLRLPYRRVEAEDGDTVGSYAKRVEAAYRSDDHAFRVEIKLRGTVSTLKTIRNLVSND